jgi:hypothetical protein
MRKIIPVLVFLLAVPGFVAADEEKALSPAVRETLRSARTVVLQVEQSYEDLDEKLSLPVAVATRERLSALGWKVVADGEAADLVVRVQLQGTPLMHDYVTAGAAALSGEQYSEARMAGQISVERGQNLLYTAEFSATSGTPHTIFQAYPRPRDAPFAKALTGYWEQISLLAGRVFGSAPIVAALGREADEERLGAATALLAFAGPGDQAAVLRTLEREDNSANTRKALILTLGVVGDGSALPALLGALQNDRGLWISSKYDLQDMMRRLFDYHLEVVKPADRRDMAQVLWAEVGISEPQIAHWALLQVEAADKAARLEEILQDKDRDERARARAAALLGQLRAPQAASRLRGVVENDASPVVRATAARGLEQLADELAVPVLRRHLAAAGEADWDRDILHEVLTKLAPEEPKP